MKGPFPIAPEGEQMNSIELDIFYPVGLVSLTRRFSLKAKLQMMRIVRAYIGRTCRIIVAPGTYRAWRAK